MSTTLARRMVGAEILKLRRSRSTIAFAVFITVGVLVIGYGVAALQHASAPLHHGPAGGLKDFQEGVRAIGDWFGMLAAILIGAEAGTLDRSSGVFRDLVITGRSRLALFAARLPAAVAVTWGAVATAYGLVLAVTFLLAGGHATPGVGLIVRSAGWLALSGAVLAMVSVSVGSLTGSRTLTLTGVIGFQAVLTPALLNTSSLGSIHDALLTAELNRFIPVSPPWSVAIGAGTAVLFLAGWLTVSIAAGGWRTCTADA